MTSCAGCRSPAPALPAAPRGPFPAFGAFRLFLEADDEPVGGLDAGVDRSRVDLGRPAAGVALIRRHARWPVELADHHLRLAYAEGALAEQAGDLAHVRAAFARVVRADPDFHDVADRLDRLTPSG
jgi:hypothetical protein